MIDWRRSLLLLAAIACVAMARVAATFPIYTNTFDEPAHLSMGMEWLVRGTYSVEVQQPPLARVAAAIGPRLSGVGYPAPMQDPAASWRNGLLILYFRGLYWRTLTLARLGILPFLLLGIVIAWAWARRLWGEAAGVLAALLLSAMPPVLGHAGLATTDCAAMATYAAALFAIDCWLTKPTALRALLVAVAVAAAVMTKFSALLFLPVGILPMLVIRRGLLARRHAAQLAPIVAGVLVLGWAAYRFSVWPVPVSIPIERIFGGPSIADAAGRWLFAHVRVPAPEALLGIWHVMHHAELGHASYLMGSLAMHGRWYFFPVALLVKTPIAFLLLAAIGLVRARGAALVPPLAALAIVTVSAASSINIGLRHILHVYPLLAVTAAGGVLALWQRGRATRALAVVLLAWFAASGALAHPDYLPYFNELAGSHPDRLLVDSDLDWGQDLGRLATLVHDRHIDHLWIAYFGTASPEIHIPADIARLPPGQMVSGWVAISETMLKGVYLRERGGYAWLNRYRPVAMAGRSIRLYFIPPPASDAPPSRPF